MKKLLALLVYVLLFTFLHSQNIIITQGFHPGEMGVHKDVIASAGETSSTGAAIVSWTVGETFIGSGSEVNAIESLEHIADFKVYPNPANDKVMVEILTKNNVEIDLTISLFNLEGKKLHAQKVQESNYKGEVNISSFPVGQYVLKITAKDGAFAESFGIQKIN